jgi:large repetitive protein
LLPKVYLQGSLFGVFSGNLMRDDLRTKNLIPRKSPYVAWNPITSADTITSNTVLATTGQDAIVDWVFVELRSATDSTKIVDSRSALVQRDGDIVDTDGTSALVFTKAIPANYFVAVRHRNHLGVMSKTKLPLSAIASVVDFRQTTTPTYVLANSAIHQSQVEVVQGKALWAGNALYDNQVIYQGTDNDVNVVYQQVIGAPGNIIGLPFFILQGYYTGDINMDGEVIFQGTANDVEYIYQNVINNHPGNILKQSFFIIQQQLPK